MVTFVVTGKVDGYFESAAQVQARKGKLWLSKEAQVHDKSSASGESEAPETAGDKHVPGHGDTAAESKQAAPPGQQATGRIAHYSMNSGDMDLMLDTTASLQLADAYGRFSTPKSAVVLISSMRHGGAFMGEVVLYMSKQLGSSLVTLGEEDLDALAEDFHRQEQQSRGGVSVPRPNVGSDQQPDLVSFTGLTEHYFATKTRRKVEKKTWQRCVAAWNAVLDDIVARNIVSPNSDAACNEATHVAPIETTEPKHKPEAVKEAHRLLSDGTPTPTAESPTVESPTAQPQPILIHFRDGKAIFDQGAVHGRRLVRRMKDAINRYRARGHNITLVISLAHGGDDDAAITPSTAQPWKTAACTCWVCACHDYKNCHNYCTLSFPRRKLGLTSQFIMQALPLNVPADWLQIGQQHLNIIAEINGRRLRRRLRLQLWRYPTAPLDLLQPKCDWSSFLDDKAMTFLTKESLSADGIENAAIPLVGRCVRKKTLTPADIDVVLNGIIQGMSDKAGRGTEAVNETSQGQMDEKSAEQKKLEEDWSQKMAQLRLQCNYNELQLINHVVNPATLTTAFDDVILDKEVIDTVKTLVHLSKLRTEAASQALVSQIKIRGAMLYGPPGTGKTHLARAVARSTGSSMLVLDGSTIHNKYVGETEKAIHAAFTLAAKLFPCIIFMDEVDALFYRRDGGDKTWQRTAITQFLQDMDGLAQDDKAPFVLVATNRPSDLDSAFLRRLPQKIPFGLPDREARNAILRLFLKEDDLDASVSVDRIAALTEGYSGSDLKSLCGEAGLFWAMEQQLGLENKDKSVTGIADEKNKTDTSAIPAALSEPEPLVVPEIRIEPGSAPDIEDSASTTEDFASSPSSSPSRATTPGYSSSETAASEVTNTDEPTTAEPKTIGEPAPLKLVLTMSHFERALSKMGPSVTKQDLRLLDEFRNGFIRQSHKTHGPSVTPKETTGSTTQPIVENSDEDGKDDETADEDDEDEETADDDAPFVEPMPIINPPDDYTDKTRLPYNYQPLPTATSIRLVKLHLIRDYQDYNKTQKYEKIRCSVVVRDLADTPDYFALSYTWGDPRTIYTDKQDIRPPASWAAPAFEIDCDGMPVTVATNLYTALLSIRSSLSAGDLARKLGPAYVTQEEADSPSGGGDGGGAAYLWIDALCINQDDLAEKGSQVPLMERIYKQARATLMWLGGGEALATAGTLESARKLDAIMEYLEQELEREGLYSEEDDGKKTKMKKAVELRCQSIDITRPERLAALGLEPIYHQELVGLYLFFSRSWFNRAWVVQEWVLSQDCVFLCGSVAVTPGGFMRLMNHMSRTGWLYQIQDLVRHNILDVETGGIPAWNMAPTFMHRTNAITSGMEGDQESGLPALFRAPWVKNDPITEIYGLFGSAEVLRFAQGFDRAKEYPPSIRREFGNRLLEQLSFSVETFRGAQASDPRDKVFAFHGLFKDTWGRPAYPPPDYTKTVAQVYAEATRVMAQTLGSRFLVFTGDMDHQGSELQLPSWVPDFSLKPSHQFLQDSPIFAAAAGLGDPHLDFLYAESGDESESTRSITAIRLQGCHIDTIAHVQEEPVGAGDLADGFRELHQLLAHLPEVSRIALPPSVPESDELMCSMEEPCWPTTWSEQDRFEVLWRTLIRDHLGDSRAHPAPASLGEQHARRLRGYLYLQILFVQLSTVKQLLEHILEEAAEAKERGSDTDPFLAQCVARLHSEDSWLRRIGDVIPDLSRSFGIADDNPFCYEEQVNTILVISAELAMLSGDIPIDSSSYGLDRPLEVPALWSGCLEILEEVFAARDARDYDRFHNGLERLSEMIGENSEMAQLKADRNTGIFKDNTHLFATADGRLGENPGRVQEGDEIWVLAGLHAPIVLRDVGRGERKVLGCAYVHGVMHGEAVSGRETEYVLLV